MSHPKWTASPKGAFPPKGEICASRPPYLSHSDQNLPKPVVSKCHLRHTICPLKASTRVASPFWGHKPPEKGKFAYAGNCICPRLTKIYANMEANRSKKAHKISPKGHHVPLKGSQNLPEKGKFVRHGPSIYHTATNIYQNMSVHSTTYAAQYILQLGPLPPFWGISPQKRGNDWPSATRIIAKFLWRSCFQGCHAVQCFLVIWGGHRREVGV